MRTSLAALNLDVLDIVASFLFEPRELVAFIETCRSLYDAGIRHLLSEVSLSRTNQVKAFNRFIRQKPHYARKIRRLSLQLQVLKTWLYTRNIWTPDGDDDQTQLSTRYVAEVIQVATNLEWLDINCAEKAFRDGDSLLVDALAACKTLKILVLKDNKYDGRLSTAIAKTLLALRAPLVELSLDNLDTMTANVLDVVAGFAKTLEALYLHGATIIDPPTHSVIFPLLSTLLLDRCDASTALLEAAFPNLQRLHVLGSGRSQNSPETFNRNEHHVCSSWKHLGYIDGTSTGISTLGLTGCTVETLHSDCRYYTDPADAEFGPLVRTLQPKILKLSFVNTQLLAQVAEHYTRLETINLCFFCWSSDDSEIVKNTILEELNNLATVLPCFSVLKHLSVEINSGICQPRVDVEEEQISFPFKWGFSCPSLDTIELEWQAAGWEHRTYNRMPVDQPRSQIIYAEFTDEEEELEVGDEERDSELEYNSTHIT